MSETNGQDRTQPTPISAGAWLAGGAPGGRGTAGAEPLAVDVTSGSSCHVDKDGHDNNEWLTTLKKTAVGSVSASQQELSLRTYILILSPGCLWAR